MKVVKVIEVLDLGMQIREARKADDRTVGEIAVAIGISVQTLNRIENEKQMLSLELLQKIEQVLDVNFGVRFDE